MLTLNYPIGADRHLHENTRHTAPAYTPYAKWRKKTLLHSCLQSHRRSPTLSKAARPIGSIKKAPRARGRPRGSS